MENTLNKIVIFKFFVQITKVPQAGANSLKRHHDSIMTLCHYAECRWAECRDLFIVMLNVIMLSVIMLNVIMLSVNMLSVRMQSVVMLNATDEPFILSVVMLSVVAPFKTFYNSPIKLTRSSLPATSALI